MRGRRQFDRHIIGPVQGVVKGGRAGGHLGQRIIASQQFGTLRQIAGVQHALYGNRHIIAIGDIAATIRKGQPRCVPDQAQYIRIFWPRT